MSEESGLVRIRRDHRERSAAAPATLYTPLVHVRYKQDRSVAVPASTLRQSGYYQPRQLPVRPLRQWISARCRRRTRASGCPPTRTDEPLLRFRARRAVGESRERIQSMVLPLSSTAQKARARPSGESARSKPNVAEENRTLSGGVISAVMTRAGMRARRPYETALTTAARRKITASAAYSRSRLRPLAMTSPCSAVAGFPADSAIHFSSLARSLVFCHRFSGSLVRHLLTTLSSAGGVNGCRSRMETGSFSSMAFTIANWLSPRRPACPSASRTASRQKRTSRCGCPPRALESAPDSCTARCPPACPAS